MSMVELVGPTMHGAKACSQHPLVAGCWVPGEGDSPNVNDTSCSTDDGGSTLTGTPRSTSVQSSDIAHKWEAATERSLAWSKQDTPYVLAEHAEWVGVEQWGDGVHEAQARIPWAALTAVVASTVPSQRKCVVPKDRATHVQLDNPRRRKFRCQRDDILISGNLQRLVYGFFWRWRWVVLTSEVLQVYRDESHWRRAPQCPLERYEVARLDTQRGDVSGENTAANEFSCYDVETGQPLAVFRGGGLSCWEEVVVAHLWTDALFIAVSRCQATSFKTHVRD